MKIACVVYEDFTALDLIGPYEVFAMWPEAEIRFFASTPGPIHSDHGLTIMPQDTPATLPDPDMIVVPGSSKPLGPLKDEVLLSWLRSASAGADWSTSVCTGSAVYAAAGLLKGKRATTHWAFRENLRAMGVDVVNQRVVFDGNFVSGAGVSAGIDMALTLTARVHGEELAKTIQLGIEYDPQPPFDSGSPDAAGASTLRLAMKVLLGDKPLATMGQFSSHLVSARARRLARRA